MLSLRLFKRLFLILVLISLLGFSNSAKGKEAANDDIDQSCRGEVSEFSCEDENTIPGGFYSSEDFFTAPLTVSCTQLGRKVYQEEGVVYTMHPTNRNYLSALCANITLIVSNFKMCFVDNINTSIKLDCRVPVKPITGNEVFYVNNLEKKGRVNCGEDAVIQSIITSKLDDIDFTIVALRCIKLNSQ